MAPKAAPSVSRNQEKTVDEMNANENVIKRLIGCINDRHVEIMDELFHDDAIMRWQQSGEIVRGAENRRGYTTPSRNCQPSRRSECSAPGIWS